MTDFKSLTIAACKRRCLKFKYLRHGRGLASLFDIAIERVSEIFHLAGATSFPTLPECLRPVVGAPAHYYLTSPLVSFWGFNQPGASFRASITSS